jgi:predicted glycosyl hydrolase (DUF1957 family)
MMQKPDTQVYWVNCLHIYQPPWQREEVVRLVTRESYELTIATLKKFPHWKLTLNIAGTLLDTFDRLGYHALLKDIALLVKRNQIELTGSSHYHAFLPQLPESEIVRQIELQEVALAKYFKKYRPKGFFAPELAYTTRIGKILRKRGYQWIILDPISTTSKPKASIRYIEKATGLTVLFRDRTISKGYPPEMIFKSLKKSSRLSRTVITATDGELYGHFHTDWQDHLKQILESDRVSTYRIIDYIGTLHAKETIRVHEASWETKSRQLRNNNPFSIWYNTRNPIHRDLWALAHYAIKLVSKNTKDPNYAWARNHLDRGLASCAWWWASEMKTSTFASLAWNPDEIERGSHELITAIRSLNKASVKAKLHGEKLYITLLEHLWTKHWKSYGTSR